MSYDNSQFHAWTFFSRNSSTMHLAVVPVVSMWNTQFRVSKIYNFWKIPSSLYKKTRNLCKSCPFFRVFGGMVYESWAPHPWAGLGLQLPPKCNQNGIVHSISHQGLLHSTATSQASMKGRFFLCPTYVQKPLALRWIVSRMISLTNINFVYIIVSYAMIIFLRGFFLPNGAA